jgi:hypothetical protein
MITAFHNNAPVRTLSSGIGPAKNQLGGRDQRYIRRASHAHNHHFVIVAHLIQHGRQIIAEACIAGLNCHLLYCKAYLYVRL